MKQIIICGIIVSFLGGIAYYMFWVFIINTAIHESANAYEKPDTTITIHNGCPDTIIVKRQSSSIFK